VEKVKMMMASDDKTNYVVNYFTFELSDLVNQSTIAPQNLPICEYEVIANPNSAHIEIIHPSELIENSTINTKEFDADKLMGDCGSVNIILSHNHSIPSVELEYCANHSDNCDGDATEDDDENDENNNSNHDENIINNNDDNSNNDEADEEDDLEDLTNLNWLTELKNITNLPPATNDAPEKQCDPPSQRFDKFLSQVNKMRENYDSRRLIYETIASEKPPFNYAQIIGMALIEEGRMTLKQICDWIENKFAYYKAHKNWNVSDTNN
jgi:hypothetical protein